MRPILLSVSSQNDPKRSISAENGLEVRPSDGQDNAVQPKVKIGSLISIFEKSPSQNSILKKSKSFSAKEKDKPGFGSRSQDDSLHARKQEKEEKPVHVRDLLRRFESVPDLAPKSPGPQETQFEALDRTIKSKLSEFKILNSKWKKELEQLLQTQKNTQAILQLAKFWSNELQKLADKASSCEIELDNRPKTNHFNNNFERAGEIHPRTPESTPTEDTVNQVNGDSIRSARMITSYFNNLNHSNSTPSQESVPEVVTGQYHVRDLSLAFEFNSIRDLEAEEDSKAIPKEEDEREQTYQEEANGYEDNNVDEREASYEDAAGGEVSVKELADSYEENARADRPGSIDTEETEADVDEVFQDDAGIQEGGPLGEVSVKEIAEKYEQTTTPDQQISANENTEEPEDANSTEQQEETPPVELHETQSEEAPSAIEVVELNCGVQDENCVAINKTDDFIYHEKTDYVP